MKENNKKIFLIIVACLLVIAALLFINKFRIAKTLEVKEDYNKIIDKYGNELESIVKKELDQSNHLLSYADLKKRINFDYDIVCKNYNIYKNGQLYLEKCTINNSEKTYDYGKKLNLKDSYLSIYENKISKKFTSAKPKDINNYNEYVLDTSKYCQDNCKNTILINNATPYIYFVSDKNNGEILNFKTNEKMVKKLKYTSLMLLKDTSYLQNFIAYKDKNKWGIYDTENDKVLVKPKYDEVDASITLKDSKPLYYIRVKNNTITVKNNNKLGVVSLKNKEEIIPCKYREINLYNTFMYVLEDKSEGYKLIDYDGYELPKYAKYNKIYYVGNDYLLVNDKNNLKLINYDNKTLYNYKNQNVYWKSPEQNFGKDPKNSNLYRWDFKVQGYNCKCISITYDLKIKKGKIENIKCKACEN